MTIRRVDTMPFASRARVRLARWVHLLRALAAEARLPRNDPASDDLWLLFGASPRSR